MWLSLEEHFGEKLYPAGLAWNMTRFQVKNDGLTAFVRVSGKAHTSEVLPFAEKVMYKYTSVPT